MNFEDYNYKIFNEHILIDHNRNHLIDTSPVKKLKESNSSESTANIKENSIVLKKQLTHHKSLRLTGSMLDSLNGTYRHESLDARSV